MEILETVHGIVRWLILGVGLFGLGAAVTGGGAERRALPVSAIFVGLLDLQLLLGACLWIFFREARAGAGPHALVMLGAIALAHVLRARVRRAPPETRRRLLILGFGLPLLVIVPAFLFLV